MLHQEGRKISALTVFSIHIFPHLTDFLFLPPGAYFWLLFLPAWVLFVILQGNLEDPSLANFPPPLPPLEAFWDAQALGLVILWILFQVLLYVLPVGKVSEKR